MNTDSTTPQEFWALLLNDVVLCQRPSKYKATKLARYLNKSTRQSNKVLKQAGKPLLPLVKVKGPVTFI